jgi:hypothetical protein
MLQAICQELSRESKYISSLLFFTKCSRRVISRLSYVEIALLSSPGPTEKKKQKAKEA